MEGSFCLQHNDRICHGLPTPFMAVLHLPQVQIRASWYCTVHPPCVCMCMEGCGLYAMAVRGLMEAIRVFQRERARQQERGKTDLSVCYLNAHTVLGTACTHSLSMNGSTDQWY